MSIPWDFQNTFCAVSYYKSIFISWVAKCIDVSMQTMNNSKEKNVFKTFKDP